MNEEDSTGPGCCTIRSCSLVPSLLRLWAKDGIFGLVLPLPPAVDWVLPTSQGSHNGLNKRNANSVCLVFD